MSNKANMLNKGIRKNDIFKIKITALANNGFGIGRYKINEDDKGDKENSDNSGKVVFVPLTAIGDEVEVRALKITKSIIYAKIVSIIKPSPDRIESDCPVFGKCGGCDFRHLSYTAELKAKERFLHDAFVHAEGLEPEFLPIVPSDNIEGYRNKAQYPVGSNINGDIVTGFYGARSHRIIENTRCKLLSPEFDEIAAFVRGFMRKKSIPVYDELKHTGAIRHICIRKGHYSGEINVCIVTRDKKHLVDLEGLAVKITERFPKITGVVLNINPNKTNVIYGNEEMVLKGRDSIFDKMCGIKVEISPRSFYQVNTPAAEKLYGIVDDFVGDERGLILDLYCGIGTIGLSLADKGGEIIGIEREESSIKNAVANAENNDLSNIRFIKGDVSDVFGAEIISDGGDERPLTVITDAARKGCERELLERIASLNPQRIVMVSCNPVTAARDCAFLEGMGYKTMTVGGVDLFPRTRHVECVVLMSRVEK